jgi:hypothetical protein
MKNPPTLSGNRFPDLAQTALVAGAPPAAALYLGGGPLAAAALGAAASALVIFGQRTSSGAPMDPGMEALGVPINAAVSFGLWHLLNRLVR